MNQYKYFHEEVRTIILANIQNKEFNVGTLSKIVGVSRSQLYRKLKKGTGLSTSSFIKKVRLNQANKLLLTTDWPISKIARYIGFNSSSYFTTSFKHMYGYPPRDKR